jgi:hypothetical protein
MGLPVGYVARQVTVPGGRSLRVEYPVSLAEQVVDEHVIPKVVASVRALASAAGAVQYALVTSLAESQLQISYLTRQARVLHSDVIPVIATAEAYETGRDWLDRLDLDPDLRDRARRELDARLDRRWGYR